MKGETKDQRFKRVAQKRVQNVLDNIRCLSQCSNTRMYQWNEDQLKKMWSAIDKEMKTCKNCYEQAEREKFRL